MSKVKDEIKRIETALNTFQEGKPLPISIADIHFILGACSRLLENNEHWEQVYNSDVKKLNEDVIKFREKWKSARKIAVRLDNEIMAYRNIFKTVNQLAWWQKTKNLKRALKSFYDAQKKYVKYGGVDDAIEDQD